MTQFEQMLQNKGYVKHILNCKTMKYELAKGHNISTLVNLAHSYFHRDDKIILQKISNSIPVFVEDVTLSTITLEDRKGEIIFGLHESKKPPTLIYPRPRIEIKRIKDGKVVTEGEYLDDSMNIVLNCIPHEEIFKAMYDNTIVLKVDLTQSKK